ncbi:MAG TPA: hypothetical protein EYQ00_01970 [Dehalococcoidia bacterium]|nr:hypothetical protein [Dehalococcoidia bacterium]
MEGLLLPIALAGAFYFILLRPMLSQNKKRKATLAELDIGDEVLTTSGPMRIHLELTEDVIVEATPDAVVSIIPASEVARVEDPELSVEEVEDPEPSVESFDKAESQDS